jgi:hypothetical protein
MKGYSQITLNVRNAKSTTETRFASNDGRSFYFLPAVGRFTFEFLLI